MPSSLDRSIVAIVDPFSVGAHLAPLFRGLGLRCASVVTTQSRHDPFYLSTYVSHDFAVEVEADTIAAVLEALADFEVLCVIAGSEPGVTFADELAERLGDVPRNAFAKTAARRNKRVMAETLAASGLRHIRHRVAQTKQEAAAAFGELGANGVVLKPLASAGADNVVFCQTTADVEAAFARIHRSTDNFGTLNETVLVQEDISRGGTEYTVNTVSCEGSHIVTDVWRMSRTLVEGTRICVWSDLVDEDDPDHRQLVEYVERVLDALGIRYGPAHSEVMMTPDGPTLIETGARLEGTCSPGAVMRTCNFNQLFLTGAAYLSPVAFHALATVRNRKRANARHVYLISQREGAVERAPDGNQLTDIPSLSELHTSLIPGARLERTTNLLTCPGHGYLIAPAAADIETGYQQFRAREPMLYDDCTRGVANS